MRKHILFALMALLAGFQLMNAVPARPGRFTVTQPDGTRITLQQHGDEWGHWLTNASGQMVRADEDGFYRVVPAVEAAAIRQKAVENRTLRRQARAQAQARARRAPRANAAPIAIGQKHFLVILVEFTNKSFAAGEGTNAAFTALLNEPGYSVNGGTGSARDYYYDNSHGVFEPIFDVYGPVKMDTTYAYYGQNDWQGNDRRPEEAVIQGCQKLDDQIDFTRYDNDGDGTVDLVFMYYAGQGEADGGSATTIWPHQWEISSTGKHLELDGKVIDSYACTNEVNGWDGKMCGIGTACHEFGHAMGLPDFYDTDYDDNGQAGGLFTFSTMDGGAYNNNGRTPPYFNIEERILLGWLDRNEVILPFAKSGTYTIPSVHEDIAYMTPTDKEGEYFVYECRGSNGWDASLPGHGMLVYHVDKSDRNVFNWATAQALWDEWNDSNSINANGNHPCFYIIPAPDQDNLKYGYTSGFYSSFDEETYGPKIPFPGKDRVTSYTPKSWNGVEGLTTFSNIAYANDVVTLRANVPSEDLDFVTIADAGSYHAGDRFTFELVRPEEVEAPASVVWYYDDEPAGADSVTLTAGTHVVDARLTFADGSQQVLTLEIEVL